MVLTHQDLQEIREITEEIFEEKTKNLPDKNELYNRLDAIMKELKASREEQTILAHKSSDHEKRIVRLEGEVFPVSA